MMTEVKAVCRTHQKLNCQCGPVDMYMHLDGQLKFKMSALEIACLVEQKQAAYGDSFGKSGKIMEILYPEGIKPDQLKDALTVVRVIDKLFRIATKKDAFGESPWRDIMGYALLEVAKEEEGHVKSNP